MKVAGVFSWYSSKSGLFKRCLRVIGHLFGVWTAEEYLEIGREIVVSKGLRKAILQIKLRKIGNVRGLGIENFSNIGEGLKLPHGINIIVNPSAKIGNNVTLYQGVTIGVIHEGEKKGAPTIEDNVQVGPNAVVVGRITIGHDSIIAGNSFVNINVPPNSIVLGNPAQIHFKK